MDLHPVNNNKMIEVKDLHKSYTKGKVNALNGVAFSVKDGGEIFGVIGPDGAGNHRSFEFLPHSCYPTEEYLDERI